MKQAGVKLWVLTGDKIETAINIGFSCQILDQEMEIFIVNQLKTKDIYRQICEYNAKRKLIGYSRDTAVVVGGDQLSKITQLSTNGKLLEEFLLLA